jgi:nucleoid-associated protein YgaU
MMRVSRSAIAPGALFLTLTAGLLGGLLAGCATGPVPPVKDPARGEFYTGPEMMRISGGERDRYCSWMENSLRELKERRRALQVRRDSLGVAADTLRSQEIAVSSRSRDLSVRVRELRLREKATNTYIVAPGDNLRKISRVLFGDGGRYKEIYEANKAIIGSENAELKAGTRLTIPRLKDQ